MKAKIFEKLKQVYAPLGLGDAFLQARAELLANLGFVTDENIESVIAAQRAELESIQKSNDKRATDAIAAEKKKAEEAAAAAKATTDAEIQKHLAKIKELEDKIKKDKDPKEQTGTIDEDKIKALIAEARKADSDELKSLKTTLEALQKGNKELEEYKAQAEKEKADREKAQAAADRKAKIENKAKELGIPEYRIKEGFVIADDADDAAIETHLSGIAQNIKVNLLPGHQAGAHLPSGDKATKEEVDGIAATLIH